MTVITMCGHGRLLAPLPAVFLADLWLLGLHHPIAMTKPLKNKYVFTEQKHYSRINARQLMNYAGRKLKRGKDGKAVTQI